MATKKTATKTSKRAEVNIPAIQNSKKQKKTSKNIQKNLKKTSLSSIAIAFLFLIVGAVIGFGAWFVVCRNDCFIINGQEQITLTLDQTYQDAGVKIIAFGKDDSSNYTVQHNLQVKDGKFYALEEGTYYIKYKTINFKYSKLFTIEKVRLITFVEPSEQEEIESANK